MTWLDVPGWEGRYQVSGDGEVRSLVIGRSNGRVDARDVPLVMAQQPNARGYRQVRLQCGGQVRLKHVHRLVLEAFVGPCPAGMQACHNDGDPANNRLANLRWDTVSANCADKVGHGTAQRGERHWCARLDAQAVQSIRASSFSIAVLARAHGVAPATVADIRAGRTWRHV